MTFENLSSVAVITGGSNGIGKAISSKLAAENILVVVADIVPPKEAPENVIFRQCDVTIGDEVDALYKWILSEIGAPDLLIINAGKGIHEQLIEGDPEKWFAVLNLNIMGALRFIRAFVPPMYQNKSGKVVFISSVSAMKAYTYGSVYSASKAALDMIAETLRLETLPYIKVTTIAAGITDSDFFDNQLLGNTSIEEMGMGSLSCKDVAEDVWYAINKKGTASINRLVTRPSGQSF
ncbi:SDR family oxidoreductase [Marivirga sp. S37H4]|uniref:SDR family oxidoreductase n=1 Tax=Marivirga aurantiaca TaxID=2802615 RepID=A0A935CAS6_9BACT|nr:SDR family oxidoreductase [Marivirga aurantiaca]MBK6264973.1 SDR family oxidoreductase [Marivirga aurantiaca]